MMRVEIKVDGTYPYSWSRLCWLSREMACSMLGVPHFGPHDNGFLNKGYRVVSVDSERAVAVYHHDGLFSLIESDSDLTREHFIETRPCLFAPNTNPDVEFRDKKCKDCYVIHNKDKNCPSCKPICDTA